MTTIDRLTGQRIGGGRYEILGRVGEGSMGQVYRARDDHLATDVVIKFPVSADAARPGPEFFERFDREIRSLVSLSHPHIVKVIDVGRHEGQPFVVMQYLSGGSLKDRVDAAEAAGRRAMPPSSLDGWLLEVAKALDFIHAQNYIHRDVKPANILFDRHGNAFLGDFGIIKAFAGGDADAPASAATAPGYLPGTPNYVAPEVVLGRPGDGRVDQYSLAMTVHEVLTGSNVMTGPTPSATMVNQTRLAPPPLFGAVPGATRRLSDAIVRALSKDPRDRFESCTAMAREALADFATLSGESPVPILYGPDDDASGGAVSASARTLPAPAAAGLARRARPLAVVAALLAVGLGVLTAYVALGWKPSPTGAGVLPPGPVVVNVAYGTEKKLWLEAALKEYEKAHDPGRVKINLIGLGSVEGARAVLEGAKPVPIHVWSPASSAYLDVFEREWEIKYGGKPVLRSENLALTPMVFVMWKSRYDEFVKKYKKVDFGTLADAMREPGGWATIAGKPEWGLFKFAHSHPGKSNSGLQTLVLLAYGFSHKSHGLTPADVTSPDFQERFRLFEGGVTRHGGSLNHSTGTLMREMVLRGPSQYDCLVLYENLAIEYLQQAREHWDDLTVVYPDPNLWNEHPYYVLNAPWSGPAERAAANDFLNFLMSEPVQRRSLEHGFRPGNPSVPVKYPESPFVRDASLGVRIEVPTMAEPPKADVVRNLLSSFQRIDR